MKPARQLRLRVLLGPLVLIIVAACAHGRPSEAMPPSADHVIAVPPDLEHLDPAGVAHVLRGLYFMQQGHSAAAIPHFRLALLYDRDSGYLHQKLAEAWVNEDRLDKAREVLEHGLARAPLDPYLTTMAGELARRSKRYGDAAVLLAQAVSDEHTVLTAGSGLVDVLAWLGRTVEAEGTVIDLMNTFPGRDDLAVELGGVLEDHGRLGTALSAYRRAREQRPGSRAAAFGEMRVLDLLGRSADGAARLAELFAYEPADVGLYVQVSRLYRRAGSPSAEAYRAEALRLAGDDLAARSVIAAADIAEGQTATGVALLQRTIGDAGKDGTARTSALLSSVVAEAYLQTGDAMRCLDTLRSAGNAAEVLRTRATCLTWADQTEQALAELRRLVDLGGSVREAVIDAARVLGTGPDEAAARRKLSAFVAAVRAGATEVSLATAVLAQQLGHEAEALALIAKLHASDAANPDLRMRFADALARSGRIDESIAILRTMVEEQPEDPTRLNALGFTMTDAGRALDDAEVYLRHAYRLASDESFIIDSLGWLAHRRGNQELAERLLTRAAHGAPNDPEILMHLGKVYEARGKYEDARSCFVKALRAHPARPVKAQLERLLPAAPVGS